ncbi:MAG: neuraminidase-like domain-containing protein, partial [Chloroflexota bacterium]|nr:neuraminidase-like domain-containing protein [Chloroflexota bacterium]
MGFERLNGVAPEQINAEEWKTISRLPVWAARQSTLLYPEELLDPSWRDNKTKGFRDFEATIRQTDVTPVNAAAAYGAFLDAFRVIASLEVCGTFLQTTFEGQEQGLFTSVLHVVGRTRGGVPRRYFYRRLNGHGNYEEWTDWTPIDADIQGIERDRPGGRVQGSNETLYEPGVHVLPVVWRGQVHLFWPTLVRKVDVPSTPPLVDAKNPTIKGRFSEPYWEVKLCWTHREGEAWTPKEQSSALVETWWTDAVDSLGGTVDYGNSVYGPNVAPVDEPELPDPNRFVLKAHVDDVSDKPSLRIVLAERNAKSQPFARFAFSFARVASEMEASFATAIAGYSGDHPTFVASGALTASFMGLKGSGALSVVTSSKKPEGDRLFTPPGGFRLTTLNQSYGAHLEAPFFIGLSDRAYFATMKRGTTSVREEIANPVSTPKVTGFAIHAHLDDVSAFATAGVPQKALYDPNPWVRASASQVGMATAGLVQSVPAINGTVTPALASATISLESEVVYRVGPRYRMVPVETVHVAVTPFFHPFAERFVTTLKRDGLDALLTPEMQRLTLPTAATFAGSCAPNSQRVTAPKTEGVDFEASSPFGTINWEIFFFAPLTVAQKLWEQNHLDAALDVFHRAVFDPMASGSDPNDAWRFEGLRQAKSLRLDTLLAQLSLPDDDPEKQQIMAQVEAMRLYPFQAHRIARLRPSAYKKWALTQYVRLRLAKGDRHFRRFTPEDVNLSIPEYLIAAAVMGPQPELIPQRVTMPAMSYAELRPHLDDLGNVMFEAETKLVSLGQGAP